MAKVIPFPLRTKPVPLPRSPEETLLSRAIAASDAEHAKAIHALSDARGGFERLASLARHYREQARLADAALSLTEEEHQEAQVAAGLYLRLERLCQTGFAEVRDVRNGGSPDRGPEGA
jgi:hypothetical protein